MPEQINRRSTALLGRSSVAVETQQAQEAVAITELDKLIGAYKMCDRLLRSPVFNRTAREVIEEQAYLVKDKLEAMGVEFTDA